jgi:serine protease DegQ
LSVRVPVAERDSDVARLADLVAQQIPVRALGVQCLNLTPQIAQLLPGVRRDKGAVVATVTPIVPYSQQGRLQPGDVIYSLNGRVVTSVADLNAIAADFKPGTAAVLHLERSGTLMFIAFRVER